MQSQLSQFDTTSELRLIQSVSNTIQDSSDPLRQANSFITSFGIGPIAWWKEVFIKDKHSMGEFENGTESRYQ